MIPLPESVTPTPQEETCDMRCVRQVVSDKWLPLRQGTNKNGGQELTCISISLSLYIYIYIYI